VYMASTPPVRSRVSFDSFVEDSQGSVSEYSARKPLHRRAPIVSENAKCSDMPGTAVEAVGIGRDVEEDLHCYAPCPRVRGLISDAKSKIETEKIHCVSKKDTTQPPTIISTIVVRFQ